MSTTQASLFGRLMLSFAALLLVLWLLLVALTAWSAVRQGDREIGREMRSTAEEILAGAEEMADRPDAIRRVVAEIERQSDLSLAALNGMGSRNRIQVWSGSTLLYGGPELPATRPPAGGTEVLKQAGRPDWVAWTARHSAAGIAVRVAVENPRGVMLRPNSLAFMLLPLAVGLPFLIVPAWFLMRSALRPLAVLSADIATRGEHELHAMPTGRYRYRELTPIVTAVNELMQRLAARLAQEQSFLNDAAHELKTPLAVIQANAEALAGTPTPARQAEAAAGLRSGLDRAVRAVHQLLSLGRSSADVAARTPAVHQLGPFVRERLAFHATCALRKGIEFAFDAQGEGPVLLDEESAAALLDNLLDNAVKYSPAGSCVQVQLSRQGDTLILRVCDRGPGIPVAFRTQVFARFWRLPGTEQPGSGLGLAIVEQAARRNGIGIQLQDPVEGPGLVVELRFAVHAAGSARA